MSLKSFILFFPRLLFFCGRATSCATNHPLKRTLCSVPDLFPHDPALQVQGGKDDAKAQEFEGFSGNRAEKT
jgi:hypothetical protein